MSERPFIPEQIRRAIVERRKCDLCGGPILTDGRARHVICELVAKDES